jgi:protein tyrosine kinase modulator
MTERTTGMAEYMSALQRRRGLLLGIALPIVALALLLAVALPDIYRSAALVEVDIDGDQQHTAAAHQANALITDPDEPSYVDQYVTSLKGTVLSSDNLRPLLKRYDLYPKLEDESQALQKLRRDIGVEIVTAPILDPRTGREREIVTAFTLSYDSRKPAKAQQVALWLVDEFMAENRKHRQGRAAGAADFFAAEAERLREQVAQLEGKLAEFKNKNFGRLPELTQLNMTMMDRTERDLEQMQMQMRSLQQERVFLTAQLQQANTANPDEGSIRQLEAEYARRQSVYDESHPDMISLRRQIDALKQGGAAGAGASLQQQLEAQRQVLAEARQRYSADHPDVKRIQRDIDALQARIAAGEGSSTSGSARTPMTMQLQTQVNAIDTQIGALQARSAELRGKLGGLERQIVETPQVEREYQNVTRDLTIARAKYEQLLNRQMDAEVTEAAIAGGRADEFRVVQAPLLPTEPSKPQRAVIAVVGIILAIIIALTFTVAREALDQTVRGGRDVRDVLSVSPLVSIPSIRNSVALRRRTWRFVTIAACVTAGIWAAFQGLQLWL